jgi:hypothetical protein
VDIASILNELSRRRIWVGVGVAVAAVIAMSAVFELPSFEKKSSVRGAASTDVLVDTRSSALGSIAIDVNELTTRAAVYARLIGATDVKKRIARLADAPADEITVVDMGLGTPGPQSAGGDSGLGTAAPPSPHALQIGAAAQEAHPVVKLQALAPTPTAAKKLADAAAGALISYVADAQAERAIPVRERVELRQLGVPQAALLVDEPDYLMAVAAFIGVFLAWCLVVLVVSRTAVALGELRAADTLSAPEADNLLVGLWDDPPAEGGFEGRRTRQHRQSQSQRAGP